MRQGDTRKFTDTDKLIELLELRRLGWTLTALAELFDCDRTSLRYQCRKYMVFPPKTVFIKNSNEVFDPKRIAHQIIIEIEPPKPPEESKWVEVDGERINIGMSYADYVKKQFSPYKQTI